MIDSERDDFDTLVLGVYDFFGKTASTFVLDVWWGALKPFDLGAVSEAMSRHIRNPDSGKWLPKPADLVTMMQGRTVDSAAVAWAAVERGVRLVGPYRSVVFDDPLIHACVEQIGGWIHLNRVENDEWPFKGNAFKEAYRGFKMRSEVPPYVPVLIGIAESTNSQTGLAVEPPTLIGDPVRARMVMTGGASHALLQIMSPERVSA